MTGKDLTNGYVGLCDSDHDPFSGYHLWAILALINQHTSLKSAALPVPKIGWAAENVQIWVVMGWLWSLSVIGNVAIR